MIEEMKEVQRQGFCVLIRYAEPVSNFELRYGGWFAHIYDTSKNGLPNNSWKGLRNRP